MAKGFGSEVATSDEGVQEVNTSVSRRRDGELRKLTNLHADMDAYLDRLSSRASEDAPKFERVLGEWNDLRPTLLADALVAEAEGGRPGDARASADFLSDTFDRWGRSSSALAERVNPERGPSSGAVCRRPSSSKS